MRYRFGRFELDADSYRLKREGEVVQAEPRVLELLAYLVAHRGRLVDKEELVREVWGGASVTDASVARTVSEARAALGDTGEEQRWIATVYGRGYRFVGEDREVAGPRRARMAAAVAVAGALGGVLLFLLHASWRDSGPMAAEDVPPRLLVLSFDHLGPPEERWFADGLTEAVTTRLAAIHDLAVLSRTTAQRYAEVGRPMNVLVHEAELDYLLEGSVLLEEGEAGSPARVRVTVQLIDLATGDHAWARTYERHLDDVFAVQAAISQDVADQLELAFAEELLSSLRVPPIDDLGADRAHVEGYRRRP